MKLHAPRMVKQHAIFTKDGRPVYGQSSAASISLSKMDGSFARQQIYTLDSPEASFNVKRLDRATEALGQQCEWRRIEDAEVCGVSF